MHVWVVNSIANFLKNPKSWFLSPPTLLRAAKFENKMSETTNSWVYRHLPRYGGNCLKKVAYVKNHVLSIRNKLGGRVTRHFKAEACTFSLAQAVFKNIDHTEF